MPSEGPRQCPPKGSGDSPARRQEPAAPASAPRGRERGWNRVGDDVDQAVQLRFANDEGRRDADAVQRHARGETAVEQRVSEPSRHLRLRRMKRLRGPVGDDLNGANQAKGAHVADAVEGGEALQPVGQLRAQAGGALNQPLVMQDLDVLERHGTARGMARHRACGW